MAATPTLQLSFSLLAASDSSPSNFLSRLGCLVLRTIRNRYQHLHLMLSLLLLFAFTLSFLVFSLYSKFAKKGNPTQTWKVPVLCEEPDVDKIPELEEIDDVRGSDPTRMPHSFLLEILPSSSPKWEKFGDGDGIQAENNGPGSVAGREAEKVVKEKRKKKKRARKKRPDSNGEEEAKEGVGIKDKEKLVCLYPFTTSSSATQRRIKQHYDELVRCHDSNGLTLAQVEQFVNCLIETRNELEHKSEAIQRRFTITKALLYRADRSSLDRLRQQIYKLELEQKRLEEDAFVYNWLQQQLKLSPAFKKMIEIGSCMETKAESSEVADAESDFADISFEELLAQEKKDAFWQRIGKSKACSG